MRALILAAGVILAALPAVAQQMSMMCLARADVVARLAETYGEVQQFMALSNGPGDMVEMFGNPETGSWTLLLTSPQGVSCLMAAGAMWEAVTPPPSGDPA